MTLKEWEEKAYRGTSGDMVFCILNDWAADRDALLRQIREGNDTAILDFTVGSKKS